MRIAKAMIWPLAVSVLLVGSERASADAPVEANRSDTIEEIVVTAQRRSESAQRVPIAIDVINGKSMISEGVVDTKDLQGKVPSLTISTAGPQLYFLRGIGTSGSSVNNEQSVATYIDGVYLYGAWGNTVPVNSVDRVEVLKGPQGTLFGRNTTGGVIQLVTKDPTEGTVLEANVGYANYQTTTADFYVADKLSPTFAFSLAGNYRNQAQGWGRDTTTGAETYWNNNKSIQAKGVWTPVDDTKVTGFFWYNNVASSGFLTQVYPGVTGADGAVSHPGRYDSVDNSPNGEHTSSELGYIRLDQNLGFANLASISAYRSLQSDFKYDYDSTALPIIIAELVQPVHDFSQEIQLLSPNSSKLKWLLGGYFFSGEAQYNPDSLEGLGVAPFSQILTYNKQTIKSGSLFAQATAPLGDTTNLTVGARYTHETIRQIDSVTNLVGVTTFTNPDQETDSNGPTWRLALDHQFTDRILGYVSYNRGLKSGGFTLTGTTNQPAYHPEKLDAYETGLKSELFDQKLRLNVAVYFYKFKNIQVLEAGTPSISTVNAAGATMKGIDGDFQAKLSTNLTAYGSFGYLHGRYTSFPNALGYQLSGASFTFDASGQTTIYSPEWNGTLGLTQAFPTEIGAFALDGFVQTLTKQFAGPANVLTLPGYTSVNTSLGWTSVSGRYNARLWAKNLLDRHYLDNGLESGFGGFQVPGAPRTYGVSLGVKF
jgi:iron complex outermembrane receptor protein